MERTILSGGSNRARDLNHNEARNAARLFGFNDLGSRSLEANSEYRCSFTAGLNLHLIGTARRFVCLLTNMTGRYEPTISYSKQDERTTRDFSRAQSPAAHVVLLCSDR